MVVRDHREFFFLDSELLFTLTLSSQSTVSRVPEESGKNDEVRLNFVLRKTEM